MPNITEYNAPAGLDITPSDRASTTARESGTTKNIFLREAGQALGTAISHVGGQVGAEIDRHNAAQWIGHGAATYSSLHADLTQQWNELASKADPNNTSIAQGFQEKILGPSLEKFQKAFEGAPDKAQQWALTRTDEMRQHFFTKMTADMGTRAGIAVHKNINDLERNYSVTAANDPSTLPHIIETIDTDIKALVDRPYLTATDAAKITEDIVPKLKQRIAQSAFDGMAQSNPNAAISALDHGDFNKYADAVTQAQWRKYAEGQYKIQKQDEREDKRQAEQDFKEASAVRREDYLSRMSDQNTGRILRVQPRLNQQINRDVEQGLMSRADANFLIRWNENQYSAQVREDKIAAEGPPARNNEAVLADLRKRVGDPDKPTTRQEVGDALAGGQLTSKAAHDLAWRVGQSDAGWQAIQRPFKQQYENVRHIFTNAPQSIGLYMDPQEASRRLNEVEADAQKILRDAYARKEDMRPYLDPNSPKWALKEAMSRLTGPPKKVIGEQAKEIRQGNVDVAAVAADARAALTAGAPAEKVKARFKEVTGQEFGGVVAAPKGQPATYEAWAAQQESLKPAVEAKGWEWNPDRWNYSLNAKGEIEREQSPGRAWLKSMYPALIKHQEITH